MVKHNQIDSTLFSHQDVIVDRNHFGEKLSLDVTSNEGYLCIKILNRQRNEVGGTEALVNI